MEDVMQLRRQRISCIGKLCVRRL